MNVLYLLLTLVLLSIMVVIHELGHFLFAKLFKVKVLEFSIGMGPAVYTTKKKKKNNEENEIEIATSLYSENNSNEQNTTENKPETDALPDKTVFSVRALPIGGYVSMAGEDDSSDDANAFCNKPVWQRLIITIAGPIMNILLGFICMFSLVTMECVQSGYLASNTVHSFQESAISNSGDEPLMAGDQIVKVNGVSVHTGNEVVYEIMNSGYKPIDLVVIRNGEKIVLHDVEFPTQVSNGATFGNYDFYVYSEKADFGSLMKHSFYRSISTVKVIVDSLKDLVMFVSSKENTNGFLPSGNRKFFFTWYWVLPFTVTTS